jgi:DTW domain-containing protein YfiP
MHVEFCFCDSIPTLDLKTRLTLVVHYKELLRPTNTGSLAVKALTNSEMLIRGEINKQIDLTHYLKPEYRPLLLYPAQNAVELTTEFINQDPRPIHLIVPDGNWRQASKVHYRHHEIKDIPRVVLPGLKTQLPTMRKETEEYGMATLQAIACAFKLIENESVGKTLMDLYEIKLKKTLIARGTHWQLHS